jgi:hypothetical protein
MTWTCLGENNEPFKMLSPEHLCSKDDFDRACQETGVIAPAPVNAHKIIRGAWSIAPVKKINKKSLLSHFIHFQLQILPPYAFKFHQM